MFESLKSLWKKDEVVVEEYNEQAIQIAEDIKALEGQLEQKPQDSDVQKQLMLTYNRALNVFAKSKQHRQQVDSLFLRIDELRNIIRRNI